MKITQHSLLIAISFFITACASKPIEFDLTSPDPDQYTAEEWARDLEENYPDDITDELVSIVTDEQQPSIEIGEPISTTIDDRFIAATWNLSALTESTKDKGIKDKATGNIVDMEPLGPGGPKGRKGALVFKMLDHYKIDIAALQEIELPVLSSPDTDFPITAALGYELLKGPQIYVGPKSQRAKYCPIAYKPGPFKCETAAKSWDLGGRKVHWAICKIPKKVTPTKVKPAQTFYFGCTHFFSPRGKPGRIKFQTNITKLFEKLLKPRIRPSITVKTESKRDSFILGADFNSYYHGFRTRDWKRNHTAWEKEARKKLGLKEKAAIEQNIDFEKLTTPPAHTKLKGNKKTGKATAVKGREAILDDLIWSLKPKGRLQYVGPKQSISVNPTIYFPFSDHLPVLATFSY